MNAAKHIIQEVIERQDKARFRYCLFKAFTESSLIVESSYDVLSRRMMDFLMTQDAVSLQIKSEFEAKGIRFGRPTQRVILTREPAAPERARQAPREPAPENSV